MLRAIASNGAGSRELPMTALADEGQRVCACLRRPRTAAAAPPHVRSYFPEALYINPEIITDGNGAPVSRFRWPTPSPRGGWRCWRPRRTERWAAATSSLKVFQDFFADLDLPVTLTQGDRVSIPVAVYNYSGAQGDVELKLRDRRTGSRWWTMRREDRRRRFRTRGRIAVHDRGEAHRQIQADAGGAA